MLSMKMKLFLGFLIVLLMEQQFIIIAHIGTSISEGGKEESLYPVDYPHYYNWSAETNSFHIGHLHLPKDAPSVHSFAHNNLQKRSYSQASQDVIVHNVFENKEGGYFVDLAANTWFYASNSIMLEEFFGWRGICIEANHYYHLDLLVHRRCQLFVNPVYSVNNEVVTFRFDNGWSGLVGKEFDNLPGAETHEVHEPEVRLTTVTLTTILDFAKAPARIEYLSLDIEGAELYAMKGLDFGRYTFLAMTVERPKMKLHFLLARHGYVFVRQLADFGETLYLHYSNPRLSFAWSRYHDKEGASWNGESQGYMAQPEWRGNVTQYLHEAELLHQKHSK